MKRFERNDPERARQYFEERLSFTTGPAELSSAMKNGTVNVVDVRATKDFKQEHITGSVNLPENDWTTDRGLARDQLNVVLCYSEVCHLAARAAVELARRGYSVMELQGGFSAWKAHHLPTESGGAAAEDPLGRARALLDERRTAEHDALRATNSEAVSKPAEREPAAGQGNTDPSMFTPTLPGPATSQPAKVGPTKPEAAKPEAVRPGPAKTESTESEPPMAGPAKAAGSRPRAPHLAVSTGKPSTG